MWHLVQWLMGLGSVFYTPPSFNSLAFSLIPFSLYLSLCLAHSRSIFLSLLALSLPPSFSLSLTSLSLSPSIFLSLSLTSLSPSFSLSYLSLSLPPSFSLSLTSLSLSLHLSLSLSLISLSLPPSFSLTLSYLSLPLSLWNTDVPLPSSSVRSCWGKKIEFSTSPSMMAPASSPLSVLRPC